MSDDTNRSRVVGGVLPLDYQKTSSFFETRGSLAGNDPLTATMYQNNGLAVRRDRAEKEAILPLLDCRSDDRVLDIGCGSGRWAEAIVPLVAAYLGVDFSEPLLEVARKRFPAAVFQQVNVAELKASDLAVSPPFSLVICSGILAYINDADIASLFAYLSRIMTDRSRIYLREPMAKDTRLTLDRHWSEELQTHYSAIYRTQAEYIKLLDSLEGFHVEAEGEPFPRELQNRVETEQRYIILKR